MVPLIELTISGYGTNLEGPWDKVMQVRCERFLAADIRRSATVTRPCTRSARRVLLWVSLLRLPAAFLDSSRTSLSLSTSDPKLTSD